MKIFLINLILLIFTTISYSESNVNIATLTEISGPYASFGKDCQHGYTVAYKYLFPSNKINILNGDHQRDPKVALKEFNRLVVNDNSIGIVATASPIVMTLNPLSRIRNIPVIGVAAHPNFLDNPYAFRFWLNAKKEGEEIAKKAFQLGLNKISIITLEDDYTLHVTESFIENFMQLGGKILMNEKLLSTENNFSPLLIKVKKSTPDAIFINYIGDQLGVLVNNLREHKITRQLFTPYSISKGEIYNNVGPVNAEGIIFLEINSNKPIFREKMKIEFENYLPTTFSYACYASLSMIGEAFRRNINIKTSNELITELNKISEVTLLDEKLKITNREAQFDTIIRTIKDGKIVDLEKS